MGTKVKGLFKGLRYISQIFDEKGDKEMEIGFPTDVKHVAHIGMDGPSANTPSWMKDFKSTQDGSSGTGNAAEGDKDSSSTKTIQGTPDSALQIINQIPKSRRSKDPDAPKSSRRSHSRGSSLDSLNQEGSSSRARRTDSLNQEGSSRTRRHRRSKQDKESTSQDGVPPKHTSRRRSKGSSVDGGSSTSRQSRKSKDQSSLTDIPFMDKGSRGSEFELGSTNKENHLRQFEKGEE